MASPSEKLGPPPEPKSKEEALVACAEHHQALVGCFKTCNFGSSFTGCCTHEHKEFWACYTRERGTNQTRVNSWLDGFFSDLGDKIKGTVQQQRQKGQQQQQQQQQPGEDQPR